MGMPIESVAVLEWSRGSMPEAYASLIETMIGEAIRDDRVHGLLLTGSLARRDALPGTDIDVRYILDPAAERCFQRGFRDGILLEQTFTTESAARTPLEDNPMHVYAYLDGVPLYDGDGALIRLRSQAQKIYRSYRTPPATRRELAGALRHPEDKVRIGLAAGDLLKATFCVSTTSWQLIEGLWAANDLPLPPKFERLFLGSPATRAETALELLGWVRGQLCEEDEGVR
jgi:hypothetical protein